MPPSGEELLTGTPWANWVETLFFPPAVSLSTLTFATVMAVSKPLGPAGYMVIARKPGGS